MPKKSKNEFLKTFAEQRSSEVDIFYIKSKREILNKTFKNPFDFFGRIIYPSAKQQNFVDSNDIDDGNLLLKRDNLTLRDYLQNNPFNISKSPQFVLNTEKPEKRTTQGVVTKSLKPIIEKRWSYNFIQNESNSVKDSERGYYASRSNSESNSSSSSLKGGLGSSIEDEYINISDSGEGMGFIPIHSNIKRIQSKSFSIQDFAKYVKRIEKDNTEMNSFLYSTLISYLAQEYLDIEKLLIIEIPVLQINDVVSSDVSKVSSNRSVQNDNRRQMLQQTIENIPVVYVMMHGGKQLFKNKQTKKLECRFMFRNPFQNLYRYIFASPGVSNIYYTVTLNKNVLTSQFTKNMTIEDTISVVDRDFPQHEIDQNADLFQLKIMTDDQQNTTEEAFFIDKNKRKQLLLNYSNTYVCRKSYSLPEIPIQDFDNWGIFVLNEIGKVKKHQNMLTNPHFIRYLEREAKSSQFKVKDCITKKGKQVEAIYELTNKVLFDYFKSLGYEQLVLIDTSCESSFHMTEEDTNKFLKLVKDNEDEISTLMTEHSTISKNPTRKAEVERQILEKTAKRRDKSYYQSQGIEGLNDLIDYTDKRAKTRKRTRFVSVISNNRGPFI